MKKTDHSKSILLNWSFIYHCGITYFSFLIASSYEGTHMYDLFESLYQNASIAVINGVICYIALVFSFYFLSMFFFIDNHELKKYWRYISFINSGCFLALYLSLLYFNHL